MAQLAKRVGQALILRYALGVERTPFDVIEPPDGSASPVLVEVPHAGLWLDAPAATFCTAPVHCLAYDADLYVDELFQDAPSLGATLIRANVSRFFVDLNRAADDYDGAAVEGGPSVERPRGVIWRVASDGSEVLRERLPRAEYERRIATIHRPYHDEVRRLLTEKRAEFGFAVLLCGHSMPTPRPRHRGATPPDVVPGTRGRTSAGPPWIEIVESAALERGWRVQHDIPYRGGYGTTYYGRPREHWHAVQIELARRLYMNETTLQKGPRDFEFVRDFARDVVRRTVRRSLEGAARRNAAQ